MACVTKCGFNQSINQCYSILSWLAQHTQLIIVCKCSCGATTNLLLLKPNVISWCVPVGPCSFSMSSDFRVSGLPQAAASYIIAPHGPTLQGQGNYELPPGEATSTSCGAVPILPAAAHSRYMHCINAGHTQAAASYIIAPHRPTLQGQGNYELPPGEATLVP
jgi:hypothetical protein